MKVIKRYNQHRRDLIIDMVCEGCEAKDTYDGAYDDRNFWDNVVPAFKCKKCGKLDSWMLRHKKKLEVLGEIKTV